MTLKIKHIKIREDQQFFLQENPSINLSSFVRKSLDEHKNNPTREQERKIDKIITIREDQSQWLKENPSVNLSIFVRKRLDEHKISQIRESQDKANGMPSAEDCAKHLCSMYCGGK